MTVNRCVRACARAATIAVMLATGACSHLYESREPTAQEKVTRYIEGLDTSGSDPRMSSLRTYGSAMARMLDLDMTDERAVHESAVSLDRRQACLSNSWGWKAEIHRKELTKALLDTEDAQAHYVAYLKAASSIPPTRDDPCNY